MALLMPTAPMAAGLKRPTMTVSTIDMALQPSSESTTGMASSNRAASSLRKRALGDTWLTEARESMVLLTLTDWRSQLIGEAAGMAVNLCGGQIQDGKVNEARLSSGAAIAMVLTDRERWPSGLRRTLGKRVYRKVPWVRIPLSPPYITPSGSERFQNPLNNQRLT